jgi:hypothetical protein
MKKEKEVSPERRNFLKLAALSAPAAAAAVGTMKPDDAQAAAVDPLLDRLQDTAHTRAYYDSARF